VTKKRLNLKTYLNIIIAIQLIFLLFFEAIRIVQEFHIDDIKAISAILSGLMGYLISGVFKEYKKLKKADNSED
jgi:glycopeptide antibiotics resistance protein